LIEAIGFTLPLNENRAAECFVATGFTFLFAPYFHPAMKALAPIRTALGIRTVFNLLGPLTNPAAPRYLLVGAYDARTAELMAGTLAGMRIERAWVVHGASGWDEPTPIGSFVAFDVAGDQVTRREVNPEEFGIARCAPLALKGGDAKANLKALLDVFEGRDQGPHLDTLVLQCGLALVIAGRAQTVAEGIALARAVIDSGKALAWLQKLRAFALHPTALHRDASQRPG
jgi:anthranilate phosphoribosyltransferase